MNIKIGLHHPPPPTHHPNLLGHFQMTYENEILEDNIKFFGLLNRRAKDEH